MARPKLGDTDTERMQLKITTAEIKAIDDWRYANRVPSRSEAVRRLCKIGLIADMYLPSANEEAQAVFKIQGNATAMELVAPPHGGEELYQWVMDHQSKNIEEQLEIHRRISFVTGLLRTAMAAIEVLKGNLSYEDAMKEAVSVEANAMEEGIMEMLAIDILREKLGYVPKFTASDKDGGE